MTNIYQHGNINVESQAGVSIDFSPSERIHVCQKNFLSSSQSRYGCLKVKSTLLPLLHSITAHSVFYPLERTGLNRRACIDEY